MKVFVVECEDWNVKLLVPEKELIHAETESKAYTYFRKHFDKRILRITHKK